MKSKLLKTILFFIIVSVLLITAPSFLTKSTDFNPTITIEPELDISRFSSYKIKANAVPEEGTLEDLKLSVTGINGDGGNCWDYFANGVCGSDTREYDMAYDEENLEWTSSNIYPDMIYPEVYFASSDVTWNNVPLNTPVRRGEYQLMHINNPFGMFGDMSFWIEFNAIPNAANSANMEVYLVESGKTISFFNTDWRSSADVELVGTLSNDAVFNHQHTANSSHHLVPLATNANGTIGSKSLSIAGDFWIILYNTSPNVNRGWNLRYHPSTLCNNNSRWYSGNQSGWSTALKSGCPDAHIHIARRTTNMDGVNAVLTGYYPNSEVYSKEQDFFFGDLPNLAPTGSSFISPTVSGSYENDLIIQWDPASDPNGSPLKYTINLLNSNGTLNKNLITNTSDTTYAWDTTGVVDGEYSLSGEVCDDGAPLPGDPLCSSFEMGSTFYIDNADPIYSLSSINITSTNGDNISKAGESIYLTFTSTGDIDPVDVNFYSGGYEVVGEVTVIEESVNHWKASFVVNSSDRSGRLDFDISGIHLNMQYISTTDSSYVDIDNDAPSLPTASPVAGTYTTTKSVTLSSVGSSSIRYSIDETDPSCTEGTLYESSISVLSDTTIKVIGCDTAGNSSSVATFAYVISIPEEEDEEDQDIPTYFEILIDKIVGNEDQEEDNTQEEIVVPDWLGKEGIHTATISVINGIKYFSSIKILVIDSKNQPIPNLEVTLYSEPRISSTNSEGIATFNEVPVGDHTLRVFYNGQYIEKTIELTDPGEERTVDLEIIKIKVEDLEEKVISLWCYIAPFVLIFVLLLILYLKKKMKAQQFS